MYKSVMAAAILSLAAFSASAAMTLNDLSPGTTVSGSDLSLEEMKGKVVAVVYWGTR